MLDIIHTITNLRIPAVRERIIKGGGRQDLFDFLNFLQSDIDDHMYYDLKKWESDIPLVIESAPDDYSHLVHFVSSLQQKGELEIIAMSFSTHGRTDPIVANWIGEFKNTLAEAITQSQQRSEPG